MTAFYALAALVAVLAYAFRRWYRAAVIRRDQQDADKLAEYKFGASFSSEAMGKPHDEATAMLAVKRAGKADQRAQLAAVSRLPKPKKPTTPKVLPMRRKA